MHLSGSSGLAGPGYRSPLADAGSHASKKIVEAGAKRRNVLIALSVLISGAVLVLGFGDVVPELDYHATLTALRRIPAFSIALSLAATALSFAALVARDASALRYVGAKVPLFAVVLAGVCGSALGAAAGLGALTGATVRYRIYGAVGVKSEDIVRLLLFVFGGFASRTFIAPLCAASRTNARAPNTLPALRSRQVEGGDREQGRGDHAWETTVGAERAANVHVKDGMSEAAFVALRTRRDATLAAPRLLLPSIQVNMRAGRFPAAEANGVRDLLISVRAKRNPEAIAS